MGKLLDFETTEKGHRPISPNRESLKENIGKIICYVDYVEPYRGTYFVRYGKIHSVKHNTLHLDDGEKTVHIKSIKEAGIKID